VAQREKRLTKRERKEQNPKRPKHDHGEQHIHCIACGKHLDPEGFDKTPPTALFLQCEHGSHFPSCVGCEIESKHRIAEHDKTNKPVKTTQAWH
jgi:hypothetical protein